MDRGWVVGALLTLAIGCGGGASPDGSRRDAGDEAGPGGGASCFPVAPSEVSWYASAEGSAEAAGTEDDPLDLATLLEAGGPAQPGDRVMLEEGTYVGRFLSTVEGAVDEPVIFFAEPGGRVVLDGNAPGDGPTLRVEGAWVEFHGLEITNGSQDRGTIDVGVDIFGAHTKLVNSIVHDTAQGIGFWSSAVDSELYGNIIYNNGTEGETRGHGHAIYTQNAEGTKRIAKNVIFFGYAYGIHAYTEGGSLRGFDIVDNVWFRTGASRPGSSTTGTSDGCLVGGLQPVGRTRLVRNQSWAPAVDARSLRLGWGGMVENEDITLLDNFVVGQVTANGSWQEGLLEGNVFHSALSGVDPADHPDNVYSSSLPTGTRVVIHENDYDPSRKDLVVYNWGEAAEVEVDLDGWLESGAEYAIYSVFDLFGAPVASGGYDGGAIAVPMGTKPPPQPNGDPAGITGADDPGRAFGVFVLRTACAP